MVWTIPSQLVLKLSWDNRLATSDFALRKRKKSE
jgi:hypothetical protein